eukprot:TRINITY_DN8907_c1_g1_i1.p1 TRINITY_DN8907_c1_g1~~TRINITY_DN8907_c1_g1_i1.p1  ORF type:complete len:142 (-),score=16.60 TRINITY_DN8907_c1_g1_i1:17-415(-)
MHGNAKSTRGRGRPRGRPSSGRSVGRPPTKRFSSDATVNPGSTNTQAAPPVPQDIDKTLDIAQLFRKDLRAMMYGFGDDPVPLQESVELVGDIVSEYITTLLLKAKANATLKGKIRYFFQHYSQEYNCKQIL